MSASRLLRLSCLWLAGIVALFATERTQVTVLSTTDQHGHIYPIDAYTQQPANYGLAKVATLIKAARVKSPDLLLIDCGDTIHGTPLEYFHNRKHNGPVDPMMLVMNWLNYDCMTVGNHEYNFGLAVLHKARREAHFPWLSANTYRMGTDETAYQPYLIKEVHGVRIGILGLTTPGIPYWENPENYAGLEFRETVAEARKWVPILRDREHVDAVIVAMHMGVEYDLASGRGGVGDVAHENAALAIARRVPGIDLILMGHTHQTVPALVVNGVLLAQAGKWDNHLLRADLFFDREPDHAWTLAAKTSTALPVTSETVADPEILALAAPYQKETEAWLGRTIGHCDQTLTATDGYVRDTALLDLIQRVQLDAGDADVSFAANFNMRARIPAGPVTVRDIAGLYVYENTLYVVEATGAQIKAALEHAARFFLSAQPGKTPAELINHAIPGYNFDQAEGVSYEIDLSRPLGDRILHLTYHGQPLAPDRKLKVAINNYRYNGGGGYTMFKDAPVISRSSTEIRDLIIDWVERHGTIPTEPTDNWYLAPIPAATPVAK